MEIGLVSSLNHHQGGTIGLWCRIAGRNIRPDIHSLLVSIIESFCLPDLLRVIIWPIPLLTLKHFILLVSIIESFCLPDLLRVIIWPIPLLTLKHLINTYVFVSRDVHVCFVPFCLMCLLIYATPSNTFIPTEDLPQGFLRLE